MSSIPSNVHSFVPPSFGETISYNHATGERVGSIQNTDMSRFPDIVRKAQQAQTLWAQKSFKERSQYILKMRDYIVENSDELAEIISKDNGKTLVDAMATEVLPSALSCNWYAKKSKKVLKKRLRPTGSILFANKLTTIEHLPVGVVGIISPWNYPMGIPFGEVVMGLMAGNAVILKVAAATPMVGEAIRKICEAGNLPKGLFEIVYGSGGEISNAMLEHGVNKLFFTGSVPAGKSIMAAAAKTLTPVSLELGGNDPMIVLNDADLERASNGAIWAGFQNSGQSCGGVERVYVQAGVYDAFMALMEKKTTALRQGVPSAHHNVDLGSMTTENQKKLVERHVKDALDKGARIVAQSNPISVNDQGFFYPATLLADVTHEMETMKDETFGPVIAVMKFNEVSEAIEYANDSNLALTSSIWTKNIKLGRQLASQIESGVTAINDHLYTHGLAETPWGGWKESGLGRTHGHEGLKEMTNEKVVNWDLINAKQNIWWHPHDQESYVALKNAMGVAFPKSVVGFIKSVMVLLPFTLKRSFSKWKV